MARITKEGLEACLAFGAAALAFAEVAELVAGCQPDQHAGHLLLELECAHRHLRHHFADGRDDVVPVLAVTVMVLADRTTNALDGPRSGSGS